MGRSLWWIGGATAAVVGTYVLWTSGRSKRKWGLLSEESPLLSMKRWPQSQSSTTPLKMLPSSSTPLKMLPPSSSTPLKLPSQSSATSTKLPSPSTLAPLKMLPQSSFALSKLSSQFSSIDSELPSQTSVTHVKLPSQSAPISFKLSSRSSAASEIPTQSSLASSELPSSSTGSKLSSDSSTTTSKLSSDPSLSNNHIRISVVGEPEVRKDMHNRQIRDRCPGLVNLGNTCFLNAVLQALSSCSNVTNWLDDFVNSGHKQSTSLAKTLNDTVKVLNNEEELYDDAYCPVEVIHALAAKRWYISPDEQDAHEMFHVLTQTIDEETIKYPGVISLFENPDTEFQQNERAMTRTHSPLPLLPHREVEHPFRGLLASQLQCVECGYRNPVRYDHFDSLSLSIPKSVMVDRTLESLLYHYISPDIVNNVECLGCSKHRPAGSKAPLKKSTFKKKLTIGKLPHCLAMHIQRCQWTDSGVPLKRREFVSYPDILDMSDYVYHKSSALKESHQETGDLSGGREPFHFGMSNQRTALSLGTAPSVNLLRTLNYDNRTTQNGLFIRPQDHTDMENQHSDVNHNGPTNTGKSTKTSLTYRLSAVVVHLGGVSSGHFVTYRRSPNTVKGRRRKEKWLCCSDTSVAAVSSVNVFSAEAYMLMYERL